MKVGQDISPGGNIIIIPVGAQFSEGHATPYQGVITQRSAIAHQPPFTFGPSYETPQDTQPDDEEAFMRHIVARLDVILTRLREGTENSAQKFARLATEWRSKTAHHSMLWKKTGHPSYHCIMGMGERALPFILAELKTDGADWFPALEAISEDDPAVVAGTEAAAINAWMEWGRNRKYVL